MQAVVKRVRCENVNQTQAILSRLSRDWRYFQNRELLTISSKKSTVYVQKNIPTTFV